jgi:hypothetical protein
LARWSLETRPPATIPADRHRPVARPADKIEYARLLRGQGVGLGAITAKTGIPKTSLHRYLVDAVPASAASTQEALIARLAGHRRPDVALLRTRRWTPPQVANCSTATGLTETTISVKGTTIDAWYSGKHHDFGANIQAIMRPDGLPVWTSHAMPGHLHDLTCAQTQGITAALNWAASELDLPALADSGYDGAGSGIKTPTKQPSDGKRLAVANRTVNRLLRGLRWQGEGGFAILVGRWKTLHHTTASPRRTSDILAAALHLTHFEYKYLPQSR